MLVYVYYLYYYFNDNNNKRAGPGCDAAEEAEEVCSVAWASVEIKSSVAIINIAIVNNSY